MSIILAFLIAWCAFALWVVFFGGAEILEGTFAARLLSPFSPRRPSAGRIRAFVGAQALAYLFLAALWWSLV
jgi:hypothetical protein